MISFSTAAPAFAHSAFGATSGRVHDLALALGVAAMGALLGAAGALVVRGRRRRLNRPDSALVQPGHVR